MKRKVTVNSDEDLIHAYNEYLEAYALPQMRALYRNLFFPPYYYYEEATGLYTFEGTLHCLYSQLKRQLIKTMNKKYAVINGSVWFQNYTVNLKGDALRQMINTFLEPPRHLKYPLYVLEWDKYLNAQEFFLDYYYVLALDVPDEVKGLFGDRLNKIYKPEHFTQYFKGKYCD